MGLDHGLNRDKPLTREERESWDEFEVRRDEREIITWRKANHIHRWFVENVQNDFDDCGEYEVTKDKLVQFLNIANTVFNSKDINAAKEALPTQGGFFFGSTYYDEYYFESLHHTIKTLTPILEKSSPDSVFTYWSSW